MTEYNDYDHSQYRSGEIYPLQNNITSGYAVKEPNVDPANKGWNGRMVNQKQEKLDFWIEDVEANFGMSGSTAQSRNVRQFMPHNVTQPSIKVSGRAPNSSQYNRMASFVRASHYNAFHPGSLGEQLRHELTTSGQSVQVQTIRLIIARGRYVWNGERTKAGQRVKGVHRPLVFEGYIKMMKAGGKRFDPAPQYQFEYFIAKSELNDSRGIGVWGDSRVYGSELKPWLDWIKKGDTFVTVTDAEASKNTLDAQEKKNSGKEPEMYGPPNPASNPFDVPSFLTGIDTSDEGG